ncbi:hypothetical protein Hanom_Chr05g00407961 [Helianthus anomalus]
MVSLSGFLLEERLGVEMERVREVRRRMKESKEDGVIFCLVLRWKELGKLGGG